MKRLLPLLLLLGCVNETEPEPGYIADYEDSRLATRDAWEQVIGRQVSNRCYNASKKVPIAEVTSFPDNCGSEETKRIAGCMEWLVYEDSVTAQMYIRSNMTEYDKVNTSVHEWVHFFEGCEISIFIGRIDDHDDSRLWDEFGTNTVEAIGKSNLTF